ncbi:hypothetical protein [Psychroflexus montanilacus]|uniref:hypothetical protein n=1 Tax=Psychroflexus montanilacus TaxID=2873598 RepID=UPI001CC9B4B5|nr:hypothetical protein [Psychroflexus montanilacus]MBZ9650721.1 hypothetical protein [Psychroflexus montanilacus]
MKKVTFVLLLSILSFSCSPKLKMIGSEQQALSPLSNTETVVDINELKTIDPSNIAAKIGAFKITDGGLALDCTYERILFMAKEKARSLGGNAVKITDHKVPDNWSTCHRIEFDIYKLNDIEAYQNELIWSEQHPLQWSYFKAAPKVEPTSSFCGYIHAQFNDLAKDNQRKVIINPKLIFDCSYVQPLKKDENLLEYNQIKFDLLEVYAREMRKAFDEAGITSSKEWIKFAESLYLEIYTKYETDIFNLEMETNFGKNYSKLNGWKYKVKKDLENLPQYSSDQI